MTEDQPPKPKLLAHVKAHVARELSAAQNAQSETVRGATHEESRPENDKDTRALEATYLARGLAERVVALEQALLALSSFSLRPLGDDDAITLGAALRLDDEPSVYFLVPDAGGLKLDVEGVRVITVTPRAPLGRALLGKLSGDDVTFQTPQGIRECILSDVW